jgi:hypothetical protein
MNDELTTWAYQWATTPPEERAAVWRAHRIDEIMASKTPVPLDAVPTVIFHMLPRELTTAPELPKIQLLYVAQGAWVNKPKIRANVEGILAANDEDHSYVQLFRNHVVEYGSSDLVSFPQSRDINFQELTRFLAGFPRAMQHAMGGNDDERTFGLTLLHVKDQRIPQRESAFDRDTIILPLVTATCSEVAPRLWRLVGEAAGQIEL